MPSLPPNLEARLQVARDHHQQGLLGDAEAGYIEVLLKAPNNFETNFALGVVAYQLGQPERAIRLFQKAISVNPSAPVPRANLGVIFHELGRFQEAVTWYDQALALRPDYADAHYNRGISLLELEQLEEALASYDRALVCRPDYEFLQGNRLHLKMRLSEWNAFEQDVDHLALSISNEKKAADPFCVLSLIESPVLQRKTAEIYCRARYSFNPILQPISAYETRERIRIGYFSADFHSHATAYLMAELFELHDRNRFEIYAFSFGPDANCAMRHRLKGSFDHFLEVRALSDQQIAERARDLGIQIAVDLKGFTEGARPGIFAHRAAPVQVNYLGYPGTMGADYMDYIIADDTLIPPQNREAYSENIVYLPDTYQPNDRNRTISNRIFNRFEENLPDDKFVFCCFNNNYKINPRLFESWMKILSTVPGSVLWLLSGTPTAKLNLRKRASQLGIDPDRLVFARQVSLAEHLGRHRLADLFLDTLPYNAHTAASDALWSGLPVLTRIGSSFAGRVAASLLRAIGLSELIAESDAEYEAMAIELATDSVKLGRLKQSLEARRATAPLFDTPRITRHLEAVYQEMISRHEAGMPPAMIRL